MQVDGDEIGEQRQHDEVQHDRRDYLVRAKARLEVAWYYADHAAAERRDGDEKRQCDERWQPPREHETEQGGDKSTGGQLAFRTDVEQSRANANREREPSEDERRRLVEHLTEAVRIPPRP